jgi:hypothetical protein
MYHRDASLGNIFTYLQRTVWDEHDFYCMYAEHIGTRIDPRIAGDDVNGRDALLVGFILTRRHLKLNHVLEYTVFLVRSSSVRYGRRPGIQSYGDRRSRILVLAWFSFILSPFAARRAGSRPRYRTIQSIHLCVLDKSGLDGKRWGNVQLPRTRSGSHRRLKRELPSSSMSAKKRASTTPGDTPYRKEDSLKAWLYADRDAIAYKSDIKYIDFRRSIQGWQPSVTEEIWQLPHWDALRPDLPGFRFSPFPS